MTQPPQPPTLSDLNGASEITDGYTCAVVAGFPAIRCHRCNAVSWNVGDIENRYCGRCHAFHVRRPGDDEAAWAPQ